MIYDCFTFFNELELLELRLNELAGVVDKFVIVEARRTFTNQPKPLHFQENRARFSAFMDKIIHVVVEDSPDANDPWVVERFQRNAIGRGLTQCRPDDFVLVSDLDEIPRAAVVAEMTEKIPYHDHMIANAVHRALNSRLVKRILHRRGFRRRLRFNHPFVWRFQHTLFRYFINCKSLLPPYSYGTVMLRYRDFSTAEEMRHSGYKTISDAGWHFTYMGGAARIADKLRSFAHQEYNRAEFTDLQRITERINLGQTIFGKGEQLTFVPVDATFPTFIREHPEKFTSWIKPL